MTSVKINPVQQIKEFGLTVNDILSDYKVAYASRQASLVGRKEVFLGRAKFGVFGDGKEILHCLWVHRKGVEECSNYTS